MTIVEGGRFDFDDGGSYIGEWCDGRAHGLGVATGPANQGEYSGEWVMGFESRGVYIWPSGNIYSGGWMKGKRHGEGVQLKGKWTYKGEFSSGFCGRYGVKESLISLSKYEGSWHLNLFDGFGVETSSDGSTYAGAWSKGVRQGLGVRKSAPYHKALTQKDPNSVRAATSQSSLLSSNENNSGIDYQQMNVMQRNAHFLSSGGVQGDMNNSPTMFDGRRPSDTQPLQHRSGFVLLANSISNNATNSLGGTGNSTLGTNNSKEKKPSFRKALFRKLRKQKSTGDLRSVRMGGSLRSTVSSNSAASQATNHSLPDTLQIHSREILDPNTTEIYSGQWKDDKRSGYGVAERSDGLRYDGEWYNNKKDGYGITVLPNGTKEEGRYKENVLVQALHKRNKLFAIRHSRLKDSVEEAVKNALDAAANAKDRAMETANQRCQTARNTAESAEMKAKESQMLSSHARDVAKEFAPDFAQLGVMWLKSKANIEEKLGGISSLAAINCLHLTDPATIAKYGGMGSNNLGGKRQITSNNQSNQYPSSAPPVPPHQLQQQQMQLQQQLEPNLLSPDQECLEVSGGSRRGSFRSSFRRSGDKKPPNYVNPQKSFQQNQQQQQQQQHQQQSLNRNNFQNTNYPNQPPSPNSLNNYSIQVPQLNQPPQKYTANQIMEPQIVQKSVSNTQSQMPRALLSTNTATIVKPSQPIKVQYATVNKFDGPMNPQIVNSSHLLEPVKFFAEEMSPNQPLKLNSQFNPTHSDEMDHYEHYGGNNNNNNNNQEEMYRRQRDNEILDSATSNRYGQQRRRSVPSIMTTKPVHPATTTVNHTNNSTNHNQPYSSNSSNEFLDSATSVSYIIENGLRKRVQAENTRPRQQPPLSPKSSRSMGRSNNRQHISIEPEADELAPLPRNYRIESQSELVQLRRRMEGSLPDVTMCNEMIRGACDNSAATSSHNNPGCSTHGGTGPHLMSREEASQLSQQRRQELLREQERQKRGEIIIRMADVKDWLKQNYTLVIIFLINILIVLGFLHIMKI